MAESAYDRKKKIPGFEHLTWVDKLRSSVMPNLERRNMDTGEISDPQTDFLKEKAEQRRREAMKAKK